MFYFPNWFQLPYFAVKLKHFCISEPKSRVISVVISLRTQMKLQNKGNVIIFFPSCHSVWYFSPSSVNHKRSRQYIFLKETFTIKLDVNRGCQAPTDTKKYQKSCPYDSCTICPAGGYFKLDKLQAIHLKSRNCSEAVILRTIASQLTASENKVAYLRFFKCIVFHSTMRLFEWILILLQTLAFFYKLQNGGRSSNWTQIK